MMSLCVCKIAEVSAHKAEFFTNLAVYIVFQNSREDVLILFVISMMYKADATKHACMYVLY